jgi:MFS family permease
LPLLALSLPAGVMADRYNRKSIIALGTAVLAALIALLALLSAAHDWVPDLAVLRAVNRGLGLIAGLFEQQTDASLLAFDRPALPLIYLVLLVMGCVRILIWPARASITPLLIPAAH